MSSSATKEQFHPGEIAIQERVGGREIAAQVGRMIRDSMPEQHRVFFSELPYVVLGALDEAGYPRASFVSKAPGFLSAPDPKTLVVDALPIAGDPALAGLRVGDPVAVLGIQLHTRRRNRANGVVTARRPLLLPAGSPLPGPAAPRDTEAHGQSLGFEPPTGALTIHVEQSFGNCPKYIVPRAILEDRAREGTPCASMGPILSDEAVRIVRAADTAFIASSHPTADGTSLDVSHRGGPPGFIQVETTAGGTKLVMPDYPGNYLYMTLGNLHEHPRAGLLLLDFERGDALSLAVEARIIWNDTTAAEAWGAERLVELSVVGGVLLSGAVPFVWAAPSPPKGRARP